MVRYCCTANRKHVWDVDKQVDAALSKLKSVPCPECNTPMERVAAKYNNEAVTVDGHRFPSLREARRYQELIALQAEGLIKDLELHPVYPLIVNGMKIGKYTADSRYFDCLKGEMVVEDVKGGQVTVTQAYKLRKKLVKALYNVDIVEVA